MSVTNDSWFEEISYLRAIAIISVLIMHTTGDTAFLHKLNTMTFTLIYIEELVRFAVPMFIFISGFVLYNKYKSELPMREFYSTRFLTILLPYIFFSIIYCLILSYPNLNYNFIINSIFNFNASGHFWYVKLILTFYIFYPVIITYYDTMKHYTGSYLLFGIFSSILILFLFSWFVYQLNIITSNPIRYLVYFLFGIYINDNYEQIIIFLKNMSFKKVISLYIPILLLPFFNMIFWVDVRCGTRFYNLIPYYGPLTEIAQIMFNLSIFVICLYFLLYYKPKTKILSEIGEYSYGIFFVHAIFHNFFAFKVLPLFSIWIANPIYYIILFSVTLLASFHTVKLMSKYRITSFIITGKLKHITI